MRHVHHEQAARLLGDGAQALKVDDARVGGCTGQQQLGLVLQREAAHLVVVDALVLLADAVGHDVEVLARHVDGRAVRQMAAVGEVHAQNGVAGLEQAKVDRQVGLCAGMGLHVGVLRAEQLAGALTGQVLHDVHVLAAAVVALAGVALGVFIGQMAAHGGHDRGGDEVLRGDQLDVVALAAQLLLHRGCDLGVGRRDQFQIQHGVIPSCCVAFA